MLGLSEANPKMLYDIADGQRPTSGRPEHTISRETLARFISEKVRSLSVLRIHGLLQKKGLSVVRNDLHDIVREEGAIEKSSYRRHIYTIPRLAKAIIRAWGITLEKKKGVGLTQLQRELGLSRGSATRLAKRGLGDFSDRPTFRGGRRLTAEEYAKLSPERVVLEYADRFGVVPAKAREILSSVLAGRKRSSKVAQLVNTAKRSVLLESIGIPFGSGEHDAAAKGLTDDLETRLGLLRELGVEDFRPFRNYLYDARNDPCDPEIASKIRVRAAYDKFFRTRDPNALTLVERRLVQPLMGLTDYAQERGVGSDAVERIITHVIDNKKKNQLVPHLIRHAKYRILLESVGLPFGSVEHEHIVTWPTAGPAESLEGKIDALKRAGIADFKTFRLFLYSNSYDPRKPEIAKLAAMRHQYMVRYAEKEREMMESADIPLDLRSVKTYQDLGDAEKRQLLKDAKKGKPEAFEKMVDIFKPMIRKHASWLSTLGIPGVTYHDSMHYCLLGLLKAVQLCKVYAAFGAYANKTVKYYGLDLAKKEASSRTSLNEPALARKYLGERGERES